MMDCEVIFNASGASFESAISWFSRYLIGRQILTLLVYILSLGRIPMALPPPAAGIMALIRRRVRSFNFSC